MLLTHPDHVRQYVGDERLTAFYSEAEAASEWISDHTNLNGHIPAPVAEATALLAAVLVSDPTAAYDEAAVPNMVRLMILPWAA